MDLSAGVHGRAGLGRYATELLTTLASQDKQTDYSIFYNRPQDAHIPPALRHLQRYVTPLSDKPWRLRVSMAHLFRLSQSTGVGSVDLFHATDHLLPYLPETSTVFTLGDLTYLSHAQAHARLNRLYLRLMMPTFLRRAEAVISISHSTHRDMQTTYRIDVSKCFVIYPGIDNRFQPVIDAASLTSVQGKYGLPDRFFLYVGTLEPRKNLSNLIRAFAAAQLEDVILVIAGKKGWMYQPIFDLVQTLGIEQKVIFTGFVADEDLPALYSLADAFVFPSLYEGFGLPVLEAMACGAPVLTSNISSLPEITGDAALLIDPLNVEEITAAIRRLANDAGLRQELRRQGVIRAAQFSWHRAGAETLEVYRYVFEKRGAEAF
jgi:glycosyltransferase involved in cell wall biosynthesis